MIKIENLIGIEDLSREIGISKYTIYSKMRKNQFPCGVKLNGKRKFKPSEIVDYFQNIGINVEVTSFM